MNTNKKTGSGKWVAVVLSVIGLIIIIRLLLPVLLKVYINNEISKSEEYNGGISRLRMSLIGGSYNIEGLRLYKTSSQRNEPVFSVDNITFNINYYSLLSGSIVGDIEITNPEVNFVTSPVVEESVQEIDDGVISITEDVAPFRIETLKITGGKVNYTDITMDPPVTFYAQDINLTAENLTNKPTPDTLLPAKVTGGANTMGNGRADFYMKLDPFASSPAFDLNFELKDLELSELNYLLNEYANIDVKGGTFSFHTEIATQEGSFLGYVKPLIHDLELAPLEEEDKGLFQRIWESVVSVASDILENPEEEQIGTRVPIEGRFEDPDINIWNSVINLLRNAFIEALVPAIDHSINIGEVKEVTQESN